MFPQQQYNYSNNTEESLDSSLNMVHAIQDKMNNDLLLSDNFTEIEAFLLELLSSKQTLGITDQAPGATDEEIVACIYNFEEAKKYAKQCQESLKNLFLNDPSKSVLSKSVLISRLNVLKQQQIQYQAMIQRAWKSLEIINEKQIQTKQQSLQASPVSPIQAATALTSPLVAQANLDSSSSHTDKSKDMGRLSFIRSSLESLAGELAIIGISVDSLINDICLRGKNVDISEVSQFLIMLRSQLDSEEIRLEEEIKELKEVYSQLHKQLQTQQGHMQQQYLQQRAKLVQKEIRDMTERLQLIKDIKNQINELDKEFYDVNKDIRFMDNQLAGLSKEKKEIDRRINLMFEDCEKCTPEELIKRANEAVALIDNFTEKLDNAYEAKKSLTYYAENIKKLKSELEQTKNDVMRNKNVSTLLESVRQCGVALLSRCSFGSFFDSAAPKTGSQFPGKNTDQQSESVKVGVDSGKKN